MTFYLEIDDPGAYYIIISGGGFGGPGGNNSEAQAIRSWVLANGKQVDYGGSGSTLYDLSNAVK